MHTIIRSKITGTLHRLGFEQERLMSSGEIGHSQTAKKKIEDSYKKWKTQCTSKTFIMAETQFGNKLSNN